MKSLFSALFALLFLICGLSGVTDVALAQDTDGPGQLDKASETALHQTTDLLQNESQRNAAIAKDAKAQEADRQLKSAAGSSENTAAVYSISAEIMDDLAKKTGGDPEKMNALLEKAKMDPAGFADSLSPEMQAKIKQAASRSPAAGQ